MKVTKEKTENSQAFLTIEVEPAEVEESMERTYHRLVKRTVVPGFRKGKTPRPILEKYIGREGLLNEALDIILPEAYEKAIKEQAIEAIAHPEIEVTQTEPLIFKAVVPLKPKVKLGDYRHIKIEPQPVVEITESQVNDVIEELRHRYATWEPVERPVQFGDLVVLGIWSNIEDKPFINQKGVQYQVTVGSTLPMLGFAEQLVGMKKDDEKEFKLKFAADDSRTELAGKEASFKVRIDEIKQEKLPEANDEFAKQINPDYQTLDALRERAKADLKLREEEKASLDYEQQVIDAAVKLTEAEFPPILVEAEIDYLLNRRFQNGRPELEAYLKSLNKTEEELRTELRPAATARVTQSLMLGKVSEEEKVEVSDTEIDTEIENMTKNVTKNKDELVKALNAPRSRESIKETLITRKTIQRLIEIAKGSVDTQTIQKEGK